MFLFARKILSGMYCFSNIQLSCIDRNFVFYAGSLLQQLADHAFGN